MLDGLLELPDAGRQIDGRGDCHHAGDEPGGGFAQFSGQLQHHIAAQRKTRQENRSALLRKLADDREQVRRLAGMVQGSAAQVLRAAATAHVESMRGATGLERGLRQAARITRLAGPFQAVNQNQMGDRLAFRRLR